MTDTTPAELLVQIRAEMLRQNITIDDLSGRLGVPLGTLRGILAGRRRLSVAHAVSIAAALGVPLSALVARAEQAVAA